MEEQDRFNDFFPLLTGRQLFSLGEIDGGLVFLGISANGEVNALMDEALFVARGSNSAPKVHHLGNRLTPHMPLPGLPHRVQIPQPLE